MTLKYPLGLLALLGIPIVILIYIIKSKYTEQTIASNYLWRLSEKFLKNKKQKPRISGLISLILEIIAITSVALIISEPVITIPASAKEYLFILDGSGSMNTIYDGKSRLEYGKEEIYKIIDSSYDGSLYTVISCKEKPEILFENMKDKPKTKKMVEDISESDLDSKCVDSLGFAQYYFNRNQSIEAYLITDKAYETENINLINVSHDEKNYAITEASNALITNGSTTEYKISGKAISYSSDEELELGAYVDDNLVKTEKINVKKGKPTDFSINTGVQAYNKLSIKIINDDSLLKDNERIFYNLEKAHNYRALLVSDRPSFIKNVLLPNDNLSVEVISIEDYKASISIAGYSLYIYDSYNPEELPTDGAVWLFNPTTNIRGSGFTVQETNVEGPVALNLLNKNSHSLIQKLTKGLLGTDVHVKKYNKYGLVSRFSVLYEYDGLPMIFTGKTDSGNREVVFSFDLHDSDFPLQLDYIILSKNLIDYSFPIIIDKNSFVCGESIIVNVIPGCDSIRVEAPSGASSYIDATGLVSEYQFKEVGSYKIKMMFGKTEKIFDIFVSLPDSESFDTNIESYKVSGEAKNDYLDGIYDKLIALFIVLAIVYMADWMVYCYEQYQLR